MPTDHSKDSHSKTHTQASHAKHEASDNRAKQAIAESTARKQEVSDKAAADKKAKEVVSPVAPDTIPLQSLTAHVEGLQSRLGELESALTPDIESVSPDAKAALRRLGIEINALRHIRG